MAGPAGASRTAPACAMPALRWEARLDGAAVPSLTELCAQIAVVTFEPGSHDLIAGGAEHRRRYLDWGLFHVEPEFLPLWRRYARALKQRNALLKSGPGAGGAGALGPGAGRSRRSA